MHTPRKRFGQHFLKDQAMIRRIIAAIAPRPNDHLVEIGPGQGAITFPLLQLAKKMEAIELDRDLVVFLNERSKQYGELIVHAADVLDFDFASIKQDNRLLRVIGNLPYNISTPLIFHLLTYSPMIADMTFMLQKEVAERLAAEPGTDHYGRLSVMLQYHCRVEIVFDVPPRSFSPPPKVDSSIVRLVPYRHLPYPVKDYALFEAIVKQAFGQRRKTLRNSLRELINDEVWERISIKSDLRPEVLSVKEFVEIANAL